MKILKQIFDFYINSSIHVALSAFALSYITLIKFEQPFDFWVLNFIFFATITGYNFVKYFGLAKFHHRSLASWLKIIQIFSMLCFLLMCFCAWHLQWESLAYIAIFGVITFLYAIPFFPKRFFMDKQKNLRSIGGLKVYVIGLVWSGVTVLLPLLNGNFQFNDDVWLTAFQRFIFVIVLMLPFEIRDLKYDSLKLSTIPQTIGVKKTKTIGILLTMVFFFIEFFKDELNSNEILMSLMITVLLVMFVIFSKKERSDYYSSFWVEGVPILWLGLHFIF